MRTSAELGDPHARLPIGALASHTGCNIETIRYYERIGLLPRPARSEGGHRMYAPDHFKRLGFVRRARELGFSVDEIKQLLRLADEQDQPCSQVKAVATRHLADTRAKIATLKAMEKVLKETVAQCEDASRTNKCPLIESLFEMRPRIRGFVALPPRRTSS